ncbi:hypothetical protein [Salinibacter sp. 10B]|nr:hypothetical protein [Salinibacter sp. 10B]
MERTTKLPARSTKKVLSDWLDRLGLYAADPFGRLCFSHDVYAIE